MLCQATNLSPMSSPSLSRGMQQQPPNFQPQPTTQAPKDLHDGPSPVVTQAASPKPLHTPRTPERKSPRDPPSLESFTQSQLGDDERSEESGRTSQDSHPSSSSLHGKHGVSNHEEEQPVQVSATIGDTPVFLQETPSAASYVGSLHEIHTPRSATSSNRTPTQATFAAQAQLAKSPIEDTSRRSEAQEKPNARQSIEKHPKPVLPPQSRLSQSPQTSNSFGTMPASARAPETDTAQRFPEESKDTFHTADSGKDPVVASLPGAQPANLRKDEPDAQASTHMGGLLSSEISPAVPLHTPQETQSGSGNPLRPIPFPPLRDSGHTLRPSKDYSTRGPSIESIQSRVTPDLPPSPISPPPQQSTARGALEQKPRTGPIHYGIDHDFISEGNNERLRNRSPSYSGSIPNRTSQDSRRSLEPNTFMDSAFWQSDQNRGGSDFPANSYPGHVAGDEPRVPRQPAANGQTGEPESPVGRRSESKPRSRRGSRSSPFFKAFGRSSESDQSSLPHMHDNQVSSTPVISPVAEGKKGRRTTLLRSLKRNSVSGSTSGRSKENITPTTTTPQSIRPVQTSPAASQRMNEESPSKGPPSTSKFNKKLQRASTSGNAEQDGGKKKRFSVIGVSIVLPSSNC